VVALQGISEDEFEQMVRWAHGRSMGITFIEVMPLGEIEGGAQQGESCCRKTVVSLSQ
jgi:molybdenum cofactor biosynthesis enzyme MoaA